MVKMYAMGRRTSVPNVAMPMTHVIPMTTNREMEPFAQYLCEVYRGEGGELQPATCQWFLWQYIHVLDFTIWF